MTDNDNENGQMSARRRQPEVRDPYRPALSITEDTQVKTSLKTVWLVIAATFLATVWGVRLEMTVDAHTSALASIKTEARYVSEKVDALLIDRGYNPHKIVQDAENPPPAVPGK